MKKIVLSSLVLINTLMGASFYDIEIGDTYYINNFGSNNDSVEVIEKRDDGKIKVKDSHGSTQIVYPSTLLTYSQLHEEERLNGYLGWGLAGAVALCYFNGNCGN
jgi:hypothetical protein